MIMYKSYPQLLSESAAFTRRLLAGSMLVALLSGGSYAASVDLDGSRTLESGTDCEVGAVYRFGTSSSYLGTNLDVLVEILGEQNDFASTNPSDNDAAQCVGFHHPTGVTLNLLSFWGEDSASDDDDGDGTSANEAFYMDLRISVVEQGTTTVQALDAMTLNLIDLDTASGVATDDVNLQKPSDIYHGGASEVVVKSTKQLSDVGVIYTNKFRGKNSGVCGDTTNTVDQSCVISTRYDTTGSVDIRVGNDSAGAARLVQLSLEESPAYQVPFGGVPVVESKVLQVEEGDAPTAIGLALPTDPDGDPLTIQISELPAVGTVTLADSSPVTVGQVGLTPADIAGLLYEAPASYSGAPPVGQFIYRVQDFFGNSVGIVDFVIASDGDLVPNATDIDDDNDGIPDTVEGNGAVDTDGDGVPDSLDLDSDNDGLTDLKESGADYQTLDTDLDGKIDDSFSFGANGLADAVETSPESGQSDYNGDGASDSPLDSDGDGIPDFRDLDSDDDGVNDIRESKGIDADGNALVDNFTDQNDNGYTDAVEGSHRPAVDTDSDGIEDYLDLDSDNDGISDIFENDYAGYDTDNDGRVDGADSDLDGIRNDVDALDATYGDAQDPAEVDTDADSHPDYRDADADNDGIPDVIEAGAEDADDDSMLDSTGDVDGDGWVDAVSPPAGGQALPVPDTDSDGIRDFRDLDSDGDGVSDYEEAYGLPDTDDDQRPDDLTDANDNGRPDSAEGLGAPADTDGDGTPDFQEAGNGRLIQTGLDGHGGGSLGGAALLLLAAAALCRRQKLKSPLLAMLSLTVLGNGVASAGDDFNRRFYGGASIVASELEPNPNGTGYQNGETGSSGYSVNVGYDLSPHWSAEVYYADLGEAEMNNADGSHADDISYQHMGISAIGYAWNMEDGFDGDKEYLSRREGLSAYGRVGVGIMDNSTSLPYERLNDAHIHLGGGLEYGFDNGLAARAEVVSYDTDALAMQMGIVKRFGDSGAPVNMGNSAALPQVQRVELQPDAPIPQVAPVKPLPRKKVQKVVVRLPYVFFATGKADLTSASVHKLKKLVATMKQYPALRLLVNGHTDSIDDEHYNLNLSLRRAAVVKKYLISQGVDGSRLQTQAFGETQPVSTNKDPKGRAQNRRVEFKLLQKQRAVRK